MTNKKINYLEPTLQALSFLNINKTILESATLWAPQFLPAAMYEEFLQESKAIYSENTSVVKGVPIVNEEGIRVALEELYNTWEDKDIPLCIRTEDGDLTLSRITELIQVIEHKFDFQELRAASYPSLADQADMQFHDAVDGTTTWKDAIQAVKDTYPKP